MRHTLRSRVLVLAALLLGGMSTTSWSDDQKPQSAISPENGVIEIFNGKELLDCYTWLKSTKLEDPKQVFSVSDGLLVISGDGLGAVVTNKEYRDYHAILEFRWGERTWGPRAKKTRDSGLLVHSVGPNGAYNGIWMTSIEAQIIEGGMGDFILVAGNDATGKAIPLSITCETARDPNGQVIWRKSNPRETFDLSNRKRINWYGRDPTWKDEIDFRGKIDPDSPVGDWNRMDVICDGGHIQVYMNGVMVNEAFDSYPTAGRLQLQTELAEIHVRKWELWPINKGPQPAVPFTP